jgi:hypothetical protein
MKITCNGKNSKGERMTFTIKSGKLPDTWDQRLVTDGKLRLIEDTPTEAVLRNWLNQKAALLASPQNNPYERAMKKWEKALLTEQGGRRSKLLSSQVMTVAYKFYRKMEQAAPDDLEEVQNSISSAAVETLEDPVHGGALWIFEDGSGYDGADGIYDPHKIDKLRRKRAEQARRPGRLQHSVTG